MIGLRIRGLLASVNGIKEVKVNGSSQQNAFRLRQMGDRSRNRRNWQQAREYYSRYLEIVPEDAAIWVQYGHSCKELGDFEAAEAAYRKGTEVAPDSADAHFWLRQLLKPDPPRPDTAAARIVTKRDTALTAHASVIAERGVADRECNKTMQDQHDIVAGGSTMRKEFDFAGYPHTPTATKDDIYYCFRLILGRLPNPEEWPGHSSEVGEDLYNVVRSYISSREFFDRGMLNKSYLEAVNLLHLSKFNIFVSKDDLAVSRSVLAGEYEPHVASVLDRHVKSGMTVLDIGANIGYLTMYLAKIVGPTGRVFAVEPNSENVVLIEASRRANGFEQVSIIQCAAGRNMGIAALNLSHCNGMTGDLPDDIGALLGAHPVPCFPLDLILPRDRPIDLIKIDVEGAELQAANGLTATIDRDHPIIVSEFSPGMMQGDTDFPALDYLNFLIHRGYHISIIEHDGSESNCGVDAMAVINAYSASGVDHIDIVAKLHEK